MADRRDDNDTTNPGTAAFSQHFQKIVDNIGLIIKGKTRVIERALLCLIAEGHLLVEDVPGVGKTSLAKALATSIDCSFGRLQFTPDVLPTDVTGVNIWNRSTGDFEFQPGPVFANIVLGDEINRASPKTQAAAEAEQKPAASPHTQAADAKAATPTSPKKKAAAKAEQKAAAVTADAKAATGQPKKRRTEYS